MNHRRSPDEQPIPADETGPGTRIPVVLLVEDEPDQLGLLTAHLQRAGCTVIGLTDAEQALALPPDLQLDVMVIDLRLPGINGWELTTRLRARYPHCPIAITSVLDVQDYPTADWVLPKPVTKAHIHDLLTHLIGKGTP